MTPPRTIMGTVMAWSWVRHPLRRRVLILIGAIVLAILSVWPRNYLAKAELIPDQNGAGLPSILGSGGGALASLGALIGTRQSIESDLSIARSEVVAAEAARELRREGLLKNGDRSGGDIDQAATALQHKVDIEAITGSILEISARDRDPSFAKSVVNAYVLAIRSRLTSISSDQSIQKKTVAANRLADASLNLAKAQSALDQFRLANRLADPKTELGAAISLVTSLQAKLQADQSALSALAPFATSDNIQVKALRAEIDALKNQIIEARANANANAGSGISVGAMAPKISEYENLYRNENYAQAEYEIYKQYSDTVTAELLSSDINMSVIEEAYVDADRQFNMSPLIALFLLIMIGVLAEFYIARPPPGWRTRAAR